MHTQKTDAALGSNAGYSVAFRPAHLTALGHLTNSDIDLIAWTLSEINSTHLTWPEAAKEIGLSRKTIMGVIKGTYAAANWANPLAKFRAFQDTRLASRTGDNFVENLQADRVLRTLNKVHTESRGLGMIIGEARAGKTTAAQEWIRRGHVGSGIYIECPVNGAVGGLLRAIGLPFGINVPKTGLVASMDRICAAINERNTLILDEAGSLIPHKGSGTSKPLETVRQIVSRTGCSVCFLITGRDNTKLTESNYQFEQLIGRFVLPPVRLPEFEIEDIEPIVKQFGEFGPAVHEKLLEVATSPGRLDRMTQVLKDTQAVAAARNHPVATDRDYHEAMEHRRMVATGARSITHLRQIEQQKKGKR